MAAEEQQSNSWVPPDLFLAKTLDSLPKRHEGSSQRLGSTVSGPVQAEVNGIPFDGCLSKTFVGRYRLDSLIGRGGFGEVWKGFDPELERVIAVKLARRDKHSNDESLQHEARKAASMSHPGIVQVYDVASIDQKFVIVSEFIDGESLAERLRRGPVSVEFAVATILNVASAVQHAHSRGLVHRDIKPGNILLRSNGDAVLTDFGLSVAENEFARISDGVSGTVKYMSPEQARGEIANIDHRSDIFSMGLVFYVMLTGRLPYPDADTQTYLKNISTRSPRPIRTIVENLPLALDQACMRCLATAPKDRFPTCLDFIEAVTASRSEAAIGQRVTTPAATKRRIDSRWWVSASGLIVTTLLLVLCGILIPPRRWQPGSGSKQNAENVSRESVAEQLSVANPIKIKPLEKGVWEPLLSRPPALVAWPSGDGREAPSFSPEQKRFAIRSDRTTWIYQCTDLEPTPFKMRAMLGVEKWLGNAGFVWGLREDPDAFPKVHYVCFCIRFFRGSAQEPAKLMVSELTLNRHDHDEIRIINRRSIAVQEIPLPEVEEVQLEISVTAEQLEVRFGPDLVWLPEHLLKTPNWLPKGISSVGIIGEGRNVVFRSLAVLPVSNE